MEVLDPVTTVDQLADRYLLEVTPNKALGTQDTDQLAIRRLRPVFGKLHPKATKPSHTYKYHDLVSKAHGNKSAKNDVSTLRHMLTKAVAWGVIDNNPLLGNLRLPNNPPRHRLVEDWEIEEALALVSPFRGVQVCQPYIRLKLLTGMRRKDLLSLRLSDLRDNGIHVMPSKTASNSGRRQIFERDDELREVIDVIKRIPPRRVGDAHLFTTRQGKPYIDAKGKCNAFDSMWQRFMDKVLLETKVTERFQERDLRAKAATDRPTLQDASDRLGHTDTAITKRVYRRKPAVVTPIRKDVK